MPKLDLLFVNPGDRKQVYQKLGSSLSAVEPPVFARLFAEHARHNGKSVAILDIPAANISAEEAAKLVHEDYDPTLVVIPVYGFQPSASTQNMSAAGKVARLIKERDPTRKILMTGTHPAALPARTLREEATDYVVDREGPVSILKTLEAIQAGVDDLSDVPSLWWLDSDGQIRQPTSFEPLIRNLEDHMPQGGWDLLDMTKYRAHNWHAFDHIGDRQPYASVHTSLGCPFKCHFCCINAPFGTNAYRTWSPESVVREIDFLATTYGVKNIKFVDEMFVLNKRHVLGICDGLAELGHDLNIWAYARIDTIKDDMLERMRAGGIRWLALGIEAANSTVRDGANKSFDDEEILAVCNTIRSHGIRVLGNYIFGLPDDTEDRMRQTLDLALEINAEFANFYSAMAYPGSPLYTDAVTQGLELPDAWHHFSQHAYDSKPLPNANLTSAQILGFRDAAFQEYFRAPSYLSMVDKTFGPEVVAHIEQMRSVPLPRRLLES